MNDDKATCRGCHRELSGAPYYTGKPAFIRPHVRALAHYFGGWVCSAACDVRVFREMRDAGVWGSIEARLMTGAHDRHAANR